MLDKIIPFLQLVIGFLLLIPVIINLLFKSEKKIINILMINNIVFTLGILMISSVLNIEYKIFWLIALLTYLVISFIEHYLLSLTSASTLVLSVLSSLMVFMLPLSKLNISLGLLNEQHLILLGILVILLFMFITVKEEKKILRAFYVGLALTAFGVINLISIYSLIMIACITVTFVVISCQKIIHVRNREHEKVKRRLEKLQSEFREELRREVNRHTFHLKEVQEKMSEINKIDNLTKAYNRKAIFDFIEKQTQDRRLKQFSLIMFDLDHFKKLNDTKGHVQGDIALKMLTQIAKECLRDSDTIGRYGGDEFLIVLPESDVHTAKNIAERFRIQIDKRSRPHYTLSMGIAHYPSDGETLARLLISADNSLYEAKRLGRNTVAYKPK